LIHDLRYAVHALLKHKTFAATAILTLALGIGANTAIFSVVSGVLIRPLPFVQPDRLVQISETSGLSPRGEAVTWSYLDTYRRESTLLEGMVGDDVGARYLRDGGDPERVMVAQRTRSPLAARRGGTRRSNVPRRRSGDCCGCRRGLLGHRWRGDGEQRPAPSS
jgi:putative ABC transport system permease protein